MVGQWLTGDPLPWFTAPSTSNPRYVFASIAGRYVVLCLFGSAAQPATRAALATVEANRPLFDGVKVAFLGISIDPADRHDGRVTDNLPGIRYLWDFDRAVSRMYGAVLDTSEATASTPHAVQYRPYWLVLDPQLRVLRAFPLAAGEAVIAFVAGLPPPALHAGVEAPAPVLVMPRVFEPEFCRQLIAHYEAEGGAPSGFMREVDGRTIAVLDTKFKRRRDHEIGDEALREAARARLARRLLPEIEKGVSVPRDAH